MEKIEEIENTIENIIDEIDEGLIEIEVLTLTPSELEDEME